MFLSEVRVAVARRRAADLLISIATSVVPAKPCRLPTTVRLRRRVSKKLRLRARWVLPPLLRLRRFAVATELERSFVSHARWVLPPAFLLCSVYTCYFNSTNKIKIFDSVGPSCVPWPYCLSHQGCRLARVAWNTYYGGHIGSRQSMSAQQSPTWVAGGWCTWWHSRCGWPLHHFFCHVKTHVLVLLSTPGTRCGLGWLKCFWC